jgi:hypothetical protein
VFLVGGPAAHFFLWLSKEVGIEIDESGQLDSQGEKLITPALIETGYELVRVGFVAERLLRIPVMINHIVVGC